MGKPDETKKIYLCQFSIIDIVAVHYKLILGFVARLLESKTAK